MDKQKNTGELHNLLGQIEEKDGKFVAAANEFEVAAHLDPSEDNLSPGEANFFCTGPTNRRSRSFRGSERYPKSPRLLIGLGMALYSRGKYDDAVKALLAAADLDPSDPRCYLFLSKAYDSVSHSGRRRDSALPPLRRLQPNNALAQYYYAMSLVEGKRAEGATADLQAIESLLQKSIALDDSLPEAHLQLGNLYADQHEWEKSIPQYLRAPATRTQSARRPLPARAGLRPYRQEGRGADRVRNLSRNSAPSIWLKIDKERAEVQQFVYNAKAAPGHKP